ncbi:MAG: multicopper oxidase domain-containing protein [Proteobacteria bacterium]|nr:multicopper oxidase domain-containing protein [Pseudomonadota bacterium]
MTKFTRRDFLAATAAAALAPAAMSRVGRAEEAPIVLRAESRTIEVNGKAATMLHIGRSDGVGGVYTEAGRRYRVNLENHLGEPTLVHWHGLMPPYQQDGVPDVSQPALEPGGVYAYDFPLAAPGTYWMHSHFGFQEQRLMAAPLIIRDPAEAGLDEQEVVVMLHDFTFRDPDEILAELQVGAAHGERTMEKSAGGMEMDLNDIEFDAYLANDRTLADPEVVGVEPGGRVRLRIINAAASTNFFLDLGGLEGELIAVDGLPVAPVRGRRFPIAIAQRLDIRLTLPAGQGAYPVFAQREGDTARTGILLATSEARIERLADHAGHKAPAVGLDLERRLAAVHPLGPRPADRTHVIDLTGSMKGYNWGLNGVAYGDHKPLELRQGERIEIAFRNKTMMAHPMHMHGLPFQVVEIDGERFAGAMRDTVLVPANGGRVTVAFDAVNPGTWVMHCHNLYHMAAGMMTTLTYVG